MDTTFPLVGSISRFKNLFSFSSNFVACVVVEKVKTDIIFTETRQHIIVN